MAGQDAATRLATLAMLEPGAREQALAALTAAQKRELVERWELWAHDGQIAPPGDWRVWLIRAGRGFGKTRAAPFGGSLALPAHFGKLRLTLAALGALPPDALGLRSARLLARVAQAVLGAPFKFSLDAPSARASRIFGFSCSRRGCSHAAFLQRF